MEFNLENPLTNAHELQLETAPSLFLSESHHMASQKYLKTLHAKDFGISLRQEAVSMILQATSKFDPFLSYLAVNYVDRFLSTQGILPPKPWVIKLLAVASTSLAAKMKETEFSSTDAQVFGGLIFDTITIKRMEILILGALKWRMRSITPFSFISFFISMFELKDPSPRQALKARAVEIILKAQKDIKLLEFKPSTIAASALLLASQELFPLEFSSFTNVISNCSYVNKENIFKCYNVIQDTAIEGYESLVDTISSLDTAVHVLNRQFCSSSEIEKSNGTITATTLRQEKDIKWSSFGTSNTTADMMREVRSYRQYY